MVIGLNPSYGKHALAVAVAVPACLLAKHVWDVYTHIQPAEKRLIFASGDISDKLRQSHTIKSLVNPRGHVSVGNTQFMDLHVPGAAGNVTDEILLAAFVRGFFAGKVLSIERWVLQIVRLNLVSYDGKNNRMSPKSLRDQFLITA